MKIYGPNTDAVNGLIEQASKITAEESAKLDAAWSSARYDALDAAWNAAMNAARVVRDAWDAAWCAWDAARGATMGAGLNIAAWLATRAAALAAVLRDLISAEDYEALAGPWESVMGPIFKGDE